MLETSLNGLCLILLCLIVLASLDTGFNIGKCRARKTGRLPVSDLYVLFFWQKHNNQRGEPDFFKNQVPLLFICGIGILTVPLPVLASVFGLVTDSTAFLASSEMPELSPSPVSPKSPLALAS